MGTRGFVGFKVDGKVYAQYQQFDSYPSGVGVTTVQRVRAMLDSVDALRTRIPKLRFVKEDGRPTADDRTRFGHLWQNVSTGEDWYSLLRDQQGDIAACLHSGIMCRLPNDRKGRPTFGRDSLFCEWAYVVDLDDECVDTYAGFRTALPTDGLWVGDKGDYGKSIGKMWNGEPMPPQDYYPLERIDRLPFSDVAGFTDDDVTAWAAGVEQREEANV